MSAYLVMGRNRDGFAVKIVKPRAVTDAVDRFLLHIITSNRGQDTPCRIWEGSARFRVDEEVVVTPHRFALMMADCDPGAGVKIKAGCGTPGCIAADHLTWKEA